MSVLLAYENNTGPRPIINYVPNGTRPQKFLEFTDIRHIKCPHGRVLRIGQVWRSNDPRRLRAVRLTCFVPECNVKEGGSMWCFLLAVTDIVSGRKSYLKPEAFTIGWNGWSLNNFQWSESWWHRGPGELRISIDVRDELSPAIRADGRP